MKAPMFDPFRRIVWPLAIAEIIMWAAMYYLFPALLLEWERDLGWSKTELSGAFTERYRPVPGSGVGAPIIVSVVNGDHRSIKPGFGHFPP